MHRRHQIFSISHGSVGVLNPNMNADAAAANWERRSYTGEDPIGVELAGALKNVYAIAAGMADGLGFENNTRASEPLSTEPIY